MPPPPVDWSDFDWFIQTWIPNHNKAILIEFGELISQVAATYAFRNNKSDLKPICISRLQNAFQKMRKNNDLDSYGRVRQECETIGRVPPRNMPYMPPPTFGGSTAASTSYRANGPPAASTYRNSNGAWSRAESSSNAYNAPRPAGSVFQLQDWKQSPMWKPIRALTNMEQLPDILASDNSHVRRERRTQFRIPPDVIEKLKSSKASPKSAPHYSLRLFATSSDHFRPPAMAIPAGAPLITNRSIPIEYPSNPDITVDEYPITFRERGLRGKAGSAPPFDLDRSAKGLDLRPNVMSAITMGHTGPTTGKKKEHAKRFWYQVVFAEMTTKDELLEQLKGRNPTSVEETITRLRKKVEEEDDIQFGTSNLSLKDTLSYMRITTPIRSSKCSHLQCFDAFWWLESNAQHPQWLCPLCNKELKFSELIVDGYFQSILNACPDEVDEVLVEAGGEWHTEDRKYGSAEWLAENPPPVKVKPTAPTPRPEQVKKEIDRDGTRSPDKGKRKVEEILLSSDDEDEPPLSRARTSLSAQNGHRPSMPPPAPSVAGSSRLPTPSMRASSSARAPSAQVEEVIDLTGLDSDEDDAPAPPPPRARTMSRSNHQPDPATPAEAADDDDDEAFFRRPDVNSTNRDVNDLYPPQPLPSQMTTIITDPWKTSVAAGKESTVRRSYDNFAGYEGPVLNDAWRRDASGLEDGIGPQRVGLVANRYGTTFGAQPMPTFGTSYFGQNRNSGGVNQWGRVDVRDNRWAPPSSSLAESTRHRDRTNSNEWEHADAVPPLRAPPMIPVTKEWVKSIWTPGQNIPSPVSRSTDLREESNSKGDQASRSSRGSTALFSPPMISPPKIPMLPHRPPTPVEEFPPVSDNFDSSASTIQDDNIGSTSRSPITPWHQQPETSRRASNSSTSSRHSNSWESPASLQPFANPGLRHFQQYISSNSTGSSKDNGHLRESTHPPISIRTSATSVSPTVAQSPRFPMPTLYDYRKEGQPNRISPPPEPPSRTDEFQKRERGIDVPSLGAVDVGARIEDSAEEILRGTEWQHRRESGY